MAKNSKPGIKKRIRPQRDELGRFAPKVGSSVPKTEWDGSAWVSKADQFEESFKSEEPGWLKGFAQAVGLRVIRFGFWISGRGLSVYHWGR